MPSRESLEVQALLEHTDHIGRVILVSEIEGYCGNDSVSVDLDPPAMVKVCRTNTNDVIRWIDNWLDPVWDVTLVVPHPQLENVRSLWVHATSRNTDGSVEPGRWSQSAFWPTISALCHHHFQRFSERLGLGLERSKND